MSKKIVKGALMAALCIAAAVPNGTLADKLIPLGAGGLTAYTITPQVTQTQFDNGLFPQGLEVGQASVELLGIKHIGLQTVNVAVNLWDPLYIAGDGNLTNVSPGAGAKIVAYACATVAGAGEIRVAIIG